MDNIYFYFSVLCVNTSSIVSIRFILASISRTALTSIFNIAADWSDWGSISSICRELLVELVLIADAVALDDKDKIYKGLNK